MVRVRWRRLLLAGVAAIGIATVSSCSSTSSEVSPVPAGDLVNLSYKLKDMNGQEVNLAAFKGRPIILNFWATWCGPCKAEIPMLVALADQYRDRQLAVLGVSVDDSPEDMRKFAAERNINYPLLVGLGQDEFQEKFDAVVAIPVTWFIRPDGTLLKKHQGPASKDWFEAQVKAMLATSPARPEAD